MQDRFKKHAQSTVDKVFKTFGEKSLVTFKPKDGSPYRVRAVFSELFWETDPGGLMMNSRQPNVFVSMVDFKADPVPRKDTIIIRNQEYNITKVEPDGGGNALLHLQSVLDEDESYLGAA